MEEQTVQMERIRRVLLIAALTGLVLLVYSTIHPFVASLVWSVILVVSLWPAYRWFRKRLPGPAWLAPLLTVLLITLGLVVPLTLIGLLAVGEAQGLVDDIRASVMGEKGDLASSIEQIPFVGENLKARLLELRARPEDFQKLLEENRQTLIGIATKAMGDVVDNLFKITVCIFCAYFLFRHGENLAEQTRRAMNRLGGTALEGLLPKVRETVRAVVYGMVMTAIGQAALAAIGFQLSGVGYPLLLALLTFVVSFIPFGPPFVWVPAAISLLLDGEVGWGIFLCAWGAGVISMIDNVLRPIFIGQATHMPILIVFIAVLGGVISFGMVGLFVGPVVMAVALALWRGWIARREDSGSSPPLWSADLESVPEAAP